MPLTHIPRPKPKEKEVDGNYKLVEVPVAYWYFVFSHGQPLTLTLLAEDKIGDNDENIVIVFAADGEEIGIRKAALTCIRHKTGIQKVKQKIDPFLKDDSKQST